MCEGVEATPPGKLTAGSLPLSALGITVAAVICVALLSFPSLGGNNYQLRVASTLFFNVALAVGFWAVYLTGLLNMTQIAFVGIGAYTTAALAIHGHWSMWAAVPASVVAALVVGVVIGYATLRLRGSYFFLVSFAFLEVTRLFFTSFFKDQFGGTNGLTGVPRPPVLPVLGASVNLASPSGYYYLTLGLMLLTVTLIWRIVSSRNGLVLRALSQSDSLAESVGISSFRYRMLIFLTSTGLAGLAGSIYAYMNLVVFPTDFGLTRAVLVVVYTVVGGVGHILGPMLGASVITVLGEWLRRFGTLEQLAYGLVLVVVMLFVQGGLVSVPGRITKGSGRLPRSVARTAWKVRLQAMSSAAWRRRREE